jgi:hypothetical protein
MTDRRSNPAASPPTTISVSFAASSAAGTPYVKFERCSPSFMRDPPGERIGYAALHQSQPCNRLAAWASPHDSTAAARTGLESGNIATNTMEESTYGA